MKQYKYLTLQERQTFEREYAAGARIADISGRLEMHTATGYAEAARGRIFGEDGEPILDENGRPAYSAEVAQRRAQEALRRRGRRHPAKTETSTT